ncbi:hypothetical protein [Psychroserpens luteolus]|uniref:hypothetical protein n=1 Tax=Psychroserpens luteolus TaxID=2855840 RepID=UPI001E5AD0C5|nr:hypothetical protein [Psychroserpens luteolus]MCD2260116.1 hypothetical protein [Psychroserpens luteolus]
MDRLILAKKTALISFTTGTILLVLQFCFQNEFAIALFGYYYLLFAIIVNSLMVLYLLGTLILKNNPIKTLKSIGILIINIPIAIVYTSIVIDYIF